MKVKDEWLELRVKRYEDGKFQAYEALTDERFDSANWTEVQQWIINLLDNVSLKIEEMTGEA